MEKNFPKDIHCLGEIEAFIRASLAFFEVDDSLAYTITFVVEELFTNTVKYNSSSTHDVNLRFERKENRLLITLQDHAANPFNPLKHNDIDPKAPLEQRTPGGLGIYLTKKMVDDIQYEYDDGLSKIIVTKIIR